MNHIAGIGQAGPLLLLIPLIQFATPHQYLSSSTGIAYSGRSIAGAFGSAVLGAISNDYVHSHYSTEVSKAAISAGLPESSAVAFVAAMQAKNFPESLKDMSGVTGAIVAAGTRESHWVYARGYRLAWWSIVPFVVLAMGCLFFIRDVKEQMTDRVEATVERVKDGEKERA